jgi:hypothetical protein
VWLADRRLGACGPKATPPRRARPATSRRMLADLIA